MTFTIPQDWPEESREAAQLVLDAHGDPDEVTDTQLLWHDTGGWKRIIATKAFHEHRFPAPHIDCVESVLNYHVPPEKATELAVFDGSVMVDRTAGEISARCHDEQANFLALNLAHDIVTGQRTVAEARQEYTRLYQAFKGGEKPPYTQEFQFELPKGSAQDPDKATV